MAKLTKRTNIMFDEQMWKILNQIADQRQISVGELIRQTIDQQLIQDHFEKLKQNDYAHQQILKHRKIHKGINYKDLINDGRKY